MTVTVPNSVRTERLHLVTSTPEILRANLDGPAALAAVLDAEIDVLPSGLNEANIRWCLEAFEETPDAAGWLLWYFICDEDDGPRRLVGVGGYKGPPTEDGTVEIGYSVGESAQRKGYATEATEALVVRAFDDVRVRAVVAETLPTSTASIGVLEKCGFACVGKGSEEGTIRYAFLRAWMDGD